MPSRYFYAACSANPPKVAVGDICFLALTPVMKIYPDALKNNFNNRGVIKKYNPFENLYFAAFGSVMNPQYGWFSGDDIDRAI